MTTGRDKPDPNPKTTARLAESGRAIAAARRARGLTQQEAAAALGISVNGFRLLEKGRRGPGKGLAARLLAEFGVAVATECPCCGRPYARRDRLGEPPA